MLPILQIGSLAIQTPGLILLVGLWIGLSFSERYSKFYKVNPDQIYNLTFTVLVSGVVGARLAVMATFPSAFIENPSSMISLNPSLLDPAGGAAIAAIAGIIYIQRKNIAPWAALDALVPTLAIMAVAIPLANLASGVAFGSPTNLPWAIDLWGASRHPTQIYQAMLAGVILWQVWPPRQNKKVISGTLFIRFVGLSSGAILFLEAFRGDSILILGGFRSMQAAAWVVLAGSLWGYFLLIHLKKE